MKPAPFTNEEIQEQTEALLAAGGPFSTAPMTINGVEYEHVFQLSNASLRDLMAMRGAQYADREFLVYEDTRWTFKETWAKAMRLAQWLIQEKGIQPGDRVAIAMRNYPEWSVAFMAIVATGAVAVPLNAWWQAEELTQGVERAEAKVVFCDLKRFLALEDQKNRLGLTFVSARDDVPNADFSFENIVSDESIPADVPQVPINPDSDFCMLYTSGSTGKPKGAMLTHRSVINALISWSFLLTIGQNLRPEVKFAPDNPAVLLVLPLFHVTALHSTLLLSWFSGRKTVLTYRWEANKAIELIKQENITNFVGVPTMAHELVQTAKPGDLDTVVDVITGGAKRPENHLLSQHEKFPDVGISSGYGLTETNSLIAYITLTDFLEHPSSAGRAIPPINQVEAFSETGEQLPRGQEGEICIKSPVTFREYLHDKEATKNAYFEGGWFRSGDIGLVDEDGYIMILDRAKDLIIRGGENISCLEVENALLGFEGVDEVSVFSVPDDVMGEIVGAAVYSQSGTVDLGELRNHVAKCLAGFKVPERLWMSPQNLPRGGTGKVDKRQIRQIALLHPAHWSA